MTNKDLANLIFKNLKLTHDDCLKKYPKRSLQENAVVTRYAPSPTGFIHMGNVYASFIERKIARQSGGIFYLRIEDTDQKRYVKDGIQRIIKDLKDFNIEFDECPLNETEEIGNYGPYIQSQRRDIYQAFVKYFIEKGWAYPCFCTENELKNMREHQMAIKDRLGYYGRYAKCRNLSIDEAYKRIESGETYVIRFKSHGDYNKKIIVNDLVKGKIEFPENDKDEVILKSTDGLPTYHFAHLVDDVLMGTTHVIRDQNWLSSTPIHIELFNLYGVNPPKYAHISPVNKKDGNSVRKLSKRKDPEAAVSYYHEMGIPVNAVMIYVATISNSNFEAWYDCNKDKSIDDFKLTFNKISKSGPLFDVEKLNSISKEYISRMKAEEVYAELLNWTNEFDVEFAKLITKYKDYTINILNIEREQKKPRKDFGCYSEIKTYIWYMYDELFNKNELKYDWQVIRDKKEIIDILNNYIDSYYDETDDKDSWFNKMKLLCNDKGYCSNMKEYKENPDNYKGSIVDISMILRVALTTKSMTPDLYEIMKLLGKERIKSRFDYIK
ncbi:MAG: glutamate--tRNA ligase [Ruminococcus sp.]|nr:glutamate--tRNA ligase [Ruminococcus sp.]